MVIFIYEIFFVVEGILKISDLKSVLGHTMNVEELEEKLENLEATVHSREEEIKKVRFFSFIFTKKTF